MDEGRYDGEFNDFGGDHVETHANYTRPAPPAASAPYTAFRLDPTSDVYGKLVDTIVSANTKADALMEKHLRDTRFPLPVRDATFILQFVIGTIYVLWNFSNTYVRGFTVRDFINRENAAEPSGESGQAGLIKMVISPLKLGRTGFKTILLTPFQCQVFSFYLK
jgi:hypothetical protein